MNMYGGDVLPDSTVAVGANSVGLLEFDLFYGPMQKVRLVAPRPLSM
jgi:hypothetical protein